LMFSRPLSVFLHGERGGALLMTPFRPPESAFKAGRRGLNAPPHGDDDGKWSPVSLICLLVDLNRNALLIRDSLGLLPIDTAYDPGRHRPPELETIQVRVKEDLAALGVRNDKGSSLSFGLCLFDLRWTVGVRGDPVADRRALKRWRLSTTMGQPPSTPPFNCISTGKTANCRPRRSI
jgi:hypothetical protein